jgi:mannose-1-phosphate guanylyltransferase
VVGESAYIDNSIISWKCKVGKWVRIEGLTCLAEEVEVRDELRLSECMVLSHKAITASSSKEILM